MTSQAKIDANRRNARLSTGPKTTDGRRRSSQNARKHGLSIAEPFSEQTLSELVEFICDGRITTPIGRLAAGRIAEATLLLWSVGAVGRALTQNAASPRSTDTGVGESDPEEQGLSYAVPEMRPLARFEKRALSRLKAATSMFDEQRCGPSPD